MTLRHDELVVLVQQQQALIAGQQATIARLEQRIRDLEGGAAPPKRMPGHTPGTTSGTGDRPPRAKRAGNATRRRALPDAQVVHALAVCPHCGAPLAGGAVKRSRAVIEIVPVQATVTEHVYLERCCPDCHRRVTPAVALAGLVVGRSRLGVGLLSLIAVLREDLRVPVAAIQRYLASVHHCHLSVGGIVGALGQVARAGQAEQACILATLFHRAGSRCRTTCSRSRAVGWV